MYVIEHINIRLVGSFNAKIFQPIWIKEKLCKNLNDLQVSFDIENFNLTYTFNHITLSPTNNFVDITYHNTTKSTINYSTTIFLKLINLLAHSPIHAIGFNIGVKIPKEEACLFTEIFKSSLKNEYPLMESKQMLTSENLSYQASVKTTKTKNNNFRLNFNYHYTYKTKADFTENTLYQHIKQTKKYLENV